MMDTRVKLAAGALLAIGSLLGIATEAHASPITEIRYACDSGQRLVVRQSGNLASVQFIDRSYQLERKRSDIGQKYLSPTAALIIDGSAAVFVAEDRLQLGQCLEASRTASAR